MESETIYLKEKNYYKEKISLLIIDITQEDFDYWTFRVRLPFGLRVIEVIYNQLPERGCYRGIIRIEQEMDSYFERIH